MHGLDAFHAFSDFRDTSAALMQHLHQRLGFSLWMVTRVAGDDWVALFVEDHGYDVHEGQVFRWADSFCSQMVQGQGPCIAPRSADIPAYAEAPIGRQVPIGAYVGVPLTRPDGGLFGTLCAIDPQVQPDEIVEELPQLELMAKMLSTILQAELDRDLERRRRERAEAEALTDKLTGLFNRRGWDQLLAAEESRCRRYGHEACVLSIDLDGLKVTNDSQGHAAGDELIRRLGAALALVVRDSDVVARVGGDEFAVIATDCDEAAGRELVMRIDSATSRLGIEASVGISPRRSPKSLASAWKTADQRMYRRKERRKTATREEPVSG